MRALGQIKSKKLYIFLSFLSKLFEENICSFTTFPISSCAVHQGLAVIKIGDEIKR